MTIEAQYRARYDKVLFPIANKLEEFLKDILSDQPRIDRISTRPKSIARFMGKAKTLTSVGTPRVRTQSAAVSMTVSDVDA